MPRNRRAVSRVLAVALAVAAIGCGAAGDLDDTENAVVLVVNSIEPVSDPFGDVLTSGGTILDDTVDVEFTAHLKAQTEPPGSPSEVALQEIIVERYQVVFTRTDGGTETPSGFTRAMTARVRVTPTGDTTLRTTTVNLVVMPSTTKAQQPISFLIAPGFEPSTGFTNIQMDATLTFFGRTISGDRVVATGQIGINFANFGDDNE